MARPPSSRRALVAPAVIASTTAMLVGGALAHRARHVAPYQPVLARVEIDGRRTARGLGPLRLGFATDTHIGPHVTAVDVERALSLLLPEIPDLLLLGGDFVCESPRYIAEAAAVLGDFAALPPLGTLGVLGNHDYSNDATRLQAAFERRGIRLLRNESAAIGDSNSGLTVVGIDDAILGRPDPAGAFAGISGAGTIVALWHEPDWAESIATNGALLQLSGHSHGGQVRLPGLGPLAAPSGGRRYVAGFHAVGTMRVYTSRGIGVYRPPVRFRCPPEVTLVTIC